MMAGSAGFEPASFRLTDECSAIELRTKIGAVGGFRTHNLGLKRPLLRRLSYDNMVLLVGFEPTISSFAGRRSIQLNYSNMVTTAGNAPALLGFQANALLLSYIAVGLYGGT